MSIVYVFWRILFLLPYFMQASKQTKNPTHITPGNLSPSQFAFPCFKYMKSVIYASQSFDFVKSIIFFKFGFFQLVRIKYCVLLLADSHLLQKHSNVSSSEFKRTSWTVHWSLRNFNGTSVAKWCCLGFRLIPQIHLQIYLSKCLPQSRSWITFTIFMAKVKISNFLNSCWHTVCLWRLFFPGEFYFFKCHNYNFISSDYSRKSGSRRQHGSHFNYGRILPVWRARSLLLVMSQ